MKQVRKSKFAKFRHIQLTCTPTIGVNSTGRIAALLKLAQYNWKRTFAWLNDQPTNRLHQSLTGLGSVHFHSTPLARRARMNVARMRATTTSTTSTVGVGVHSERASLVAVLHRTIFRLDWSLFQSGHWRWRRLKVDRRERRRRRLLCCSRQQIVALIFLYLGLDACTKVHAVVER